MPRTIATALAVAVLLAATAAKQARAQTIRGAVTELASARPLADVQLTVLDADGKQLRAGVRSDSLGVFVTHAGRAGKYRLRATRIGYQPLTTDPIELDLGQLVVLRLQMTTVPQQLATVRIVERRRLHASELMTAAGFDLRRSRGTGTFMSAEELAKYGVLDAREVLRADASIAWIRASANGEVLSLVGRGPNGCAPEIVLDGLPLATGAMTDEYSGRRESALAALAGYAANDLHGIEIYRFRQLPPPSMAGLLGMAQGELGRANQCGVVAIWTKNGIIRGSANPVTVDGSAAVQVVRGTVIDFDTNLPVADATLSLIGSNDRVVGQPVRADSTGQFTIRTTRAGAFRIQMRGPAFRSVTTPPFQLAGEELVIYRLFVSAKGGVLAPLGLVGRTSPRDFAPGTIAAFAYRKERGLNGTFFGAAEIGRSSAQTIGELVGAHDALVERVAAPARTATDAAQIAARRCATTWFVDGAMLSAAAATEFRATPLASIAGIEIYRSPKDAPEIFATPAHPDCGMVLIWTTSAK